MAIVSTSWLDSALIALIVVFLVPSLPQFQCTTNLNTYIRQSRYPLLKALKQLLSSQFPNIFNSHITLLFPLHYHSTHYISAGQSLNTSSRGSLAFPSNSNTCSLPHLLSSLHRCNLSREDSPSPPFSNILCALFYFFFITFKIASVLYLLFALPRIEN